MKKIHPNIIPICKPVLNFGFKLQNNSLFIKKIPRLIHKSVKVFLLLDPILIYYLVHYFE